MSDKISAEPKVDSQLDCSAEAWLGKTVTSRPCSGWGDEPVTGVAARHPRQNIGDGWFYLIMSDGTKCLAATQEFYPPNDMP